MKPTDTGIAYDKISAWWNDQESLGTIKTGVDFVRKALKFAADSGGEALDVGCGSGGRVVATLLHAGFHVTGVDVSERMLACAKARHPDSEFVLADICEWRHQKRYDVVIAWDSIFHVPYSEQRRVVGKLCNALASGGVILFTAGGIDGEITGRMHGEDFYYSSLIEEEYLKVIRENGCKCILMERDQHPEEHMVLIGVKG